VIIYEKIKTCDHFDITMYKFENYPMLLVVNRNSIIYYTLYSYRLNSQIITLK